MLFTLRYDPSVRTGLFTYAILPVDAGLLPVLVWPQLRHAWPLMQIEHPRIRAALLGWLLIVVTLVALVTAAASGATLIDAARCLLLAVLIGGAMAFFSLAVTARWGVGWALAWTPVRDQLLRDYRWRCPRSERTLWIIAPTAWPETATSVARFVVASVVGALLFAGSSGLAHRRLKGMQGRG